jgi:tetrahydromethanopterin S-methyltransferase subunit B
MSRDKALEFHRKQKKEKIMPRSPSRDKFGIPQAFYSALFTGIWVGAALSVLFTVWVVVANRMQSLERFADLRNAAAAASFFLVCLIPLVRFRNSANQFFTSGAVGWAIASLCYFVWSLYFGRLQNRMSAQQFFVMGIAIYGLAAILVWLGGLLRSARVHHVSMQPAPRRRGH